MAEVLVDNNNTTGTFCVYLSCDDNFASLMVNTKFLGLKKRSWEMSTMG